MDREFARISRRTLLRLGEPSLLHVSPDVVDDGNSRIGVKAKNDDPRMLKMQVQPAGETPVRTGLPLADLGTRVTFQPTRSICSRNAGRRLVQLFRVRQIPVIERRGRESRPAATGTRAVSGAA